MKAPVNKIIEFSNVDGPGNRLVVFFQGCPFKCLYCHNPETLRLCNNCGLCVSACPSKALSIVDNKVVYDKDKCRDCDTCTKTCPDFSDPKVKEYEVEEIINKVKEYKSFIRGITVSGGEAMMYIEFLSELFKEVKALDLSCLIDSNGFYSFKDHPDLMEYCDGVMLDVKAYDDEFHKLLTGKSNHSILANLNYLLDTNKLTEVRTVLLPNQQDNNKKTIEYVIGQIGDLCDYKLIKYRPQGVHESGLRVFDDRELDEKEFQDYINYAKSLGAGRLIVR